MERKTMDGCGQNIDNQIRNRPNFVNPLKKVKRLRDSNIPKTGFPSSYISKRCKLLLFCTQRIAPVV